MAQALDAATSYMDNISAWRFINPPQAFSRGVLVGPSGKRICNELYYGAQVGDLIMDDHDGKAWVIIDDKLRKQVRQDLSLKKALWFHGVLAYLFLWGDTKRAVSIRGLATKIGVDPQQLQETINSYNQLANSEEQDPLGKPKEFVSHLGQAPYYAINVEYHSTVVPCPSLSLGGLAVNEASGLVKDTNGDDIQGLYAVGRTAVGIASQGYVSGLSIADCIFSGRRAGKHSANQT